MPVIPSHMKACVLRESTFGSPRTAFRYETVRNVFPDCRNNTGASVKVGDPVVLHCGTWDSRCPYVRSGAEAVYSPSFKIWGMRRIGAPSRSTPVSRNSNVSPSPKNCPGSNRP
jgi:hypothetical protein